MPQPQQQKIWLDGELVPSAQAKISVFDHGLLYGDGVFEGIRIYNGRIFKLRTHLGRLYDSARAIRLQIPYPLEELAEATHQTVRANKLSDGYIRLCVTRGVGTLGLNPLTCTQPSVFIIAGTIALYPQEMYESGLALITSSVIRNHSAALSPRIKSLNYLNNIMAKVEALDAGLIEAVMLNHQGNVAECTGDNIFVVRHEPQGPIIRTPPLHAGILEGVTRNEVIKLADELGFRLEETDLTRHDLYVAHEIFLTGTAAEVIPATKVDGRVIGEGQVGEVTRQLMDAFRRLVADQAPED